MHPRGYTLRKSKTSRNKVLKGTSNPTFKTLMISSMGNDVLCLKYTTTLETSTNMVVHALPSF
ncbi:hypothetical protein E2C01_009715 [Portunus trituberculatus]|uniref:Uncharacterized protein n=1 Tax=Portunus trituberculatus TaxID=210409 RepID=A0A5B7D6R7_PORTR|nr:hypothetical protein [Portunus trituberculatus]